MSRADRLHATGRLRVGTDGRLWRMCSQCETWKPQDRDHFSPHNSRPCAFQSLCKSCRSKNMSDYRYAKERGLI